MEFTNRCNVNTFTRCLIRGFEYFSGVTDVLLTDRMKTVILGTDEKNYMELDFLRTLLRRSALPLDFAGQAPPDRSKVETGIKTKVLEKGERQIWLYGNPYNSD